jgi:tRNA 2-selenouridine synthase
MALTPISAVDCLARIDHFDAIIDARSEGEYALDHLPGALNWPSLNDEERVLVGTEYKQISPFVARKRGAALVARNVASHIERHVLDKPRDWQPLVYCWRGGQRSGSLALVLGQIGFRVQVVEGGYRAYRRAVMDELESLPERFQFRVLCGKTGSGKSRLLTALHAQGAQVLDLEALACHRGSILGGLPGQPQPTQKAFDNRLWQTLRLLDASRPVFVESESKKIGRLQLPDALIERLHQHGQVLRVDMADAARVQLLLEDYGFFADDPEHFCRLLDGLVALRGKDTVAGWQALARSGAWADVFAQLMQQHYDPLYNRSIDRHYAAYATAPVVSVAGPGAPEMRAAARALLA